MISAPAKSRPELTQEAYKHYRPMVVSLCTEYGQAHLVEDALSAMRLSIYKATERYDPEKNDNFINFVRLRAHGSVIDFLRGIGPRAPGGALTVAEEKIYKRLVDTTIGFKAMGDGLGISERTVRVQARSVYAKHGVNTRLELMLKYWRDKCGEAQAKQPTEET